MLKIKAENLAVLTRTLGTFEGVVSSLGKAQNLALPPDVKEKALALLADAVAVIGISGLSYSKGFLDLVLSRVRDDQPLDRICRAFESLQEGIRIELEQTYVFSLSANEAAYFAPATPLFGDVVARRFQGAAFEIDEAAKCFALNRYTAAVFHLMRIMEIGVTAARQSLGIPDPIKPAQRNWGFILNKFDEEIKQRNKAVPPRWVAAVDSDFFAEAYVSLDAVRNVWRNATMHVEKVYTEEDAEHVFSAVRAFMRKLASRVDEQGLPLA